MTDTVKKLAVGLFAAIFAVSLAIPTMSAAEPEPSGDTNAAEPAPTPGDDNDSVTPPEAETPTNPDDGSAPGADTGTGAEQPDGDCVITLEYYENVTYEDPDKPPTTADGRRLMGVITLGGAHEGDVLDVWDVAVNIPGYFFFDAWPAKLTVSADPSQNVVQLFYVRLWNSSYTVNYYLMTGADLTADNWGDALAPDDVHFTKMGSQTFDHQPFDALVEGDAYEYKLNGTYVIDTYPAEIRLGLNPDDNVINVLYTPESPFLPDDGTKPPANEGDGSQKPPASDDSSATPPNGGGSTSTPTLPGDTTLDKDDLVTILPDDVLVPDGVTEGSDPSDSDEVVDDFVGADVDENGNVEITDDMLDHPVNKEENQKLAEAYRTGVAQGAALAQTGDATTAWVVALVAAVAVAIAGIAIFVSHRNKGKGGDGRAA